MWGWLLCAHHLMCSRFSVHGGTVPFFQTNRLLNVLRGQSFLLTSWFWCHAASLMRGPAAGLTVSGVLSLWSISKSGSEFLFFFFFFAAVFLPLENQNLWKSVWSCYNMPTWYFFPQMTTFLRFAASSYQANVAPADFCIMPSQANFCVCLVDKKFSSLFQKNSQSGSENVASWWFVTTRLINQQLPLI